MAVILWLTVYFQSMVELWIDYLLYSLSVMYYLSTGSLDGSLHVNLENGSADVFVARSENVFIDTKQGKNFISIIATSSLLACLLWHSPPFNAFRMLWLVWCTRDIRLIRSLSSISFTGLLVTDCITYKLDSLSPTVSLAN